MVLHVIDHVTVKNPVAGVERDDLEILRLSDGGESIGVSEAQSTRRRSVQTNDDFKPKSLHQSVGTCIGSNNCMLVRTSGNGLVRLLGFD